MPLTTLLGREGIQLHPGSGTFETADFEAIIVPVFAGGNTPLSLPLPATQAEELATIARRFEMAKPGDALWVPRGASADVLLISLGQDIDGSARRDTLRTAAAVAGRKTRGRGSVLCLLECGSSEPAGEMLAEHWLLGAYDHTAYLSSPPAAPDCAVTVWGASDSQLERGRLLADAANYARDLTNTSAADLTPVDLEDECRRVADGLGIGIHVLTEAELTTGSFGGLMAVGCGSDNPPRLIELVYEPVPGPFIALIGKGITYDAGGLSIKDTEGMAPMKSDMAGAASVLAAIAAVASLGCQVNVRAYLACAENAVGPRSTRPGDVCQLRDGTTVELNNMDAEGRLVLADAMAYAKERGASELLDIATLTWGSGLGPEIFAVLGTDTSVVASVLSAAGSSGEPAWELPLWEGYQSSLESSVADLKNFGPHSEKPFITLTGGLFLQRFAGSTPWAHLDIATTVMRDESTDRSSAGATGVGVRTLVRYLLAPS